MSNSRRCVHYIAVAQVLIVITATPESMSIGIYIYKQCRIMENVAQWDSGLKEGKKWAGLGQAARQVSRQTGRNNIMTAA